MKLHFAYSVYANGRTAIRVFDDEGAPFATLSANFPEIELEPGTFVMKDWSENTELAAAVRAAGCFRFTGMGVTMPYGGVAGIYAAPETPPDPIEFDWAG